MTSIPIRARHTAPLQNVPRPRRAQQAAPLLALFLIASPIMAWAKPNIQAVQEDLQTVHRTLEQTQHNVARRLKEVNAEQQNLANIEKKMAEHHSQRAKLEKEGKRLSQEIANLQKHQAELQKKHEEILNRVAHIAVQQLKTYKREPLSTLFLSTDPTLWVKQLKYYEILQTSEQQILADTALAVEQLNDSKQQLLQKQASLQETSKRIQAISDKLNDEQKTRQTLLARLYLDIESHETQIALLKKDEKALQAVLNELSQVTSKKTKSTELGRTEIARHKTPPVARQLFKLTNNRMLSESKYPNFISVKPGTPVHSILPGKVVFSDWLRGFGLLIIIDHGQGLMSLYGNNERLIKATGDTVSADETVAYTGQTGGISEPGLYFEVRKKGHPVDPIAWFKP